MADFRALVRDVAHCGDWVWLSDSPDGRFLPPGHSRTLKSEVVTGLLLGFTLSTAFLISQRRTSLKGFSWPQVGAALLVPFVLMSHGRVATTQQFLERFAASLAGMEKPYTRADLFRQ